MDMKVKHLPQHQVRQVIFLVIYGLQKNVGTFKRNTFPLCRSLCKDIIKDYTFDKTWSWWFIV